MKMLLALLVVLVVTGCSFDSAVTVKICVVNGDSLRTARDTVTTKCARVDAGR